MNTFDEIERMILEQFQRIDHRMSPMDQQALSTLRQGWDECSLAEQEQWRSNTRSTIESLNSNPAQKEVLQAISYLLSYPLANKKGVDTNELMILGDKLWRTVKWTDDDEELVDRVTGAMQLDSIHFQLRYAWLYRWTDLGFPTIRISAPFAASAMTTVAQNDVLSDLEPPWRAFLIEMPKEPVLYLFDERTTTPPPVVRIMVLCEKPELFKHIQSTDRSTPSFKNAWTFTLEPGTMGMSLTAIRKSTLQLGKPLDYCPCCNGEHTVRPAYDDPGSDHPWDDINNTGDKTMMLAGRLITSIACGITDPTNIRQVNRQAHEKWGNKKRRLFGGECPEKREYQITTPVTINLVPHVVEYQLKKTKEEWKLALRYVVRGHQKLQPYGPNHSMRRIIWIKPYWRGPEAAPVAVRPYIIKP